MVIIDRLISADCICMKKPCIVQLLNLFFLGLIFAGTEVESHNMPFFSKLNEAFSAIATTNPNNENWLNSKSHFQYCSS